MILSIDVDAQKGFTPICSDELPVPEGDEIVDALNAQAKICDYRVGTKDCHPVNPVWKATEEKPQFSPIENEPNADIHWNSHCVIGTKGNELLDGLPDVTEYDFFVFKGVENNLHPYGACYHDLEEKLSTGLIEYIRDNSIEAIVVSGLSGEYCVATTAIQLAKAVGKMGATPVIVNLEACRHLSDEKLVEAIKEMESNYVSIAKDLEEVKLHLKSRGIQYND